MKKLKWTKKSWAILGIIIAVVVVGITAGVLLAGGEEDLGAPLLTVETPQKLSASQTDPFTLKVCISDLGEARYPAASLCIGFDASRLEFLGVEEGNVLIYGNGDQTQLPQWNCSIQASNETGQINVMYLDLTGGKYAFAGELLGEGDNIVLGLRFRLRSSARAGDVLDVTVEDAVFAASDENQSLAVTRQTLKTRNGKIVVGG